jgi:hypothetical protein
MPKASFTQCVCILFNKTPTLGQIEQALIQKVDIVNRIEEMSEWQFFGPSITIGFRPEVNGFAAVDVVARPWPDAMGDENDDPTLFGAWAMGYFGPGAFPQGLERAQDQSWAWDDEQIVLDNHSAFVRIRLSYVFGEEDEDAPMMPDDYDSLEELEFVNLITTELLAMDGAICCFNPNGEVLLDRKAFAETLAFHEEHDSIPFELWTNVRLFQVDDEWALLDTVGNMQFDIPDIEAAYHADTADPDDINEFVRNVSWYMLDPDNAIEDGDEVEGPGAVPWLATFCDDSLSDPPRAVVRLVPQDGRVLPDDLITEPGIEFEDEEETDDAEPDAE